ncbi:MAG: vWA domain-containing protein [Aggregatilineales bacterium]
MVFLTPLALLAGLLAIPIILLYMLRLRRREVVVSSTFLWERLVRDSEANTPWQRLRRSLLLLLQLLILAALTLALARPFVAVPALGSGRIVVLLDASASMNAADVNGRARFAAAQEEALAIVDTLSAGDTMTVIRVADAPEVIAPATSDRAALRAAIARARPGQGHADWPGALGLVDPSGLAGEGRLTVVIISDGGLGDPALLPTVPGEVVYVPVGTSASNLALTALAARALPGHRPQLFAQITNYGDTDAEAVFSLYVDGALFDSQFYTVPAGQEVALLSERLPDGAQAVEAALTLPADSTYVDYLALDNRAWTVLDTAAARRVLLMTPGNLFLEQALRSLPGVQAFRGDLARGLPAQPFDLYIFDSWLPPALPPGDLLIVNPPASTPLFTLGAENSRTANPRARADDPRTAFVDVRNARVLVFREVTGADWAEPLIAVDGGPLLLAGSADGRQVAVLTFDLHNSDLPLQIAWPVLMANLMDWYTPPSLTGGVHNLRVGEPLALQPPAAADSVRVTLPGGGQQTLPAAGGPLVFASAEQAGLYTAEALASGAVVSRAAFAVNLFEPLESDIRPRAAVTLGRQAVAPSAREDVGQLEFWPLLALAALAALLLEWHIYHRRMRVPSRRAVAARAGR